MLTFLLSFLACSFIYIILFVLEFLKHQFTVQVLSYITYQSSCFIVFLLV